MRTRSFIATVTLALAVSGCVTTAVKEPRTICQTEHGLSFTTGYDQGKFKCVTDKRDEGAILGVSLSRGGKERFSLYIYTRNKTTPNERIADITPESFIKKIEDNYARDGDTKYPYRLENEEVSTVAVGGVKGKLHKRRLVINGFHRPVSFLFFETNTFEYAAALTPHWYGVNNGNADSMMQEVIRSITIQGESVQSSDVMSSPVEGVSTDMRLHDRRDYAVSRD